MTETEEVIMSAEFKAWSKTPRHGSTRCVITTKIDGTNACFVIKDDEIVSIQSRKRHIKLGDDNYGFAFWVDQNKEEILEMGDGYHYGEWAGPGIQKNPHNLEEKTFFSFETFRPVDTLPNCIKQVPILLQGELTDEATFQALEDAKTGIIENAEGIVIYSLDTKHRTKITYENAQGKWKKNLATEKEPKVMTVNLTTTEYLSLLNSQSVMECLDDAGVDNWDGCDSAFENLEQYEEENVIIVDSLVKKQSQ